MGDIGQLEGPDPDALNELSNRSVKQARPIAINPLYPYGKRYVRILKTNSLGLHTQNLSSKL